MTEITSTSPSHQAQNNEDEEDEIVENINMTQKLIRRTRLIKFFNTIIFLVSVIIILISATDGEKTTGYHLVAYVIAIIYVIGAIYFLSIVFGSKQLHYIYVKRKSIIGFTNFVLPNCTIEENTRTIKSISAVTATFGSNAHGLFSRSAYASVGATFTAIIIQWNDNDLQLNEQIASILMLCGIFGNGLYSTWELEGPNNYLSTTMHYSCAPLIFILQTLAYCIKVQWTALSIILFVVGIILDIFYVIVLYGLPETSEDLNKVHRISLLCIISEFAALTIPCFSVVLFVYSL